MDKAVSHTTQFLIQSARSEGLQFQASVPGCPSPEELNLLMILGRGLLFIFFVGESIFIGGFDFLDCPVLLNFLSTLLGVFLFRVLLVAASIGLPKTDSSVSQNCARTKSMNFKLLYI